MQNAIAQDQMGPAMLDILRARSRIYRSAKRYQAAILIVLIFLIAGGVAAEYLPKLKPYVAFLALIVGIVEACFLDRWLKGRLTAGAKLGEQFDCGVLRMKWNEALVGEKVDPEEIARHIPKPGGTAEESRIANWYPGDLGGIPLHMARLICQRANLQYDKALRTAYRTILVVGLFAIVAAAVMHGIWSDGSLTSFVLVVAAPGTPLLIWALRDFTRQGDSLVTVERLRADVEKLCRRALDGVAAEEITNKSRDLQDGIYNHRIADPLIFEWLYKLRRPGLESEMSAGAQHWIEEFKKKKG